MVRAAQEAVMQRPNFAIDAIGDSDGEEDDDGDLEGGEDDAGVLDEVEAFLKAHGDDDEGLSGEQKQVAEGRFPSDASSAPLTSTDLLTAEPMDVKADGKATGSTLVDL